MSANWQHTDGRLDFAQPFLIHTAYNDRNEDLVTAKLDATLSHNVQLFIKPYYHSWRSHYTKFDNTIPPSDQLIIIEDNGPWGYKDYGANVLAKLQFDPRLEYFVGYDVQSYGGNDAVLVITQHNETTNALFAQIRTTPALLSNVILAAGARYSDPSVGQSATVWNVSGRWDIGSSLFVRGQVGTAFRLPTAEELFANDPDDERGNPNLKPEESTNANLSVGQSHLGAAQLGWELIGFYRKISNLIDYATFDPLTNQAVFGNVPGTVHTRGAQLALDLAPSAWISGHLDFTYNHSIDPSTEEQIALVPTNLLKASLDVHPQIVPFGVTVAVNHVGTLIATGLWDGSESYGNYTVVDLNGRYFIGEQRRQRIDLSVQNLFDHRYASRLGSGVRDFDGSSYTYWDLGVPLTVRLAYTYLFQ